MLNVNTARGAFAGIWMPSAAQLKQVYTSLVDEAFTKGTAKRLAAPPRGVEKYASVDITAPGTLGADRQVFVYKGELYLKQTPASANAKPIWYDVGCAPMF